MCHQEQKSKASEFFKNLGVDHDPYVRMAARLFYMDENEIDMLTRFRVKNNLFFIDIEGVKLEETAKNLWDYYQKKIKKENKDSAFRDEDHFYEHYLFITEDIFNKYPGWYDFVMEEENDD